MATKKPMNWWNVAGWTIIATVVATVVSVLLAVNKLISSV